MNQAGVDGLRVQCICYDSFACGSPGFKCGFQSNSIIYCHRTSLFALWEGFGFVMAQDRGFPSSYAAEKFLVPLSMLRAKHSSTVISIVFDASFLKFWDNVCFSQSSGHAVR